MSGGDRTPWALLTIGAAIELYLIITFAALAYGVFFSGRVDLMGEGPVLGQIAFEAGYAAVWPCHLIECE